MLVERSQVVQTVFLPGFTLGYCDFWDLALFHSGILCPLIVFGLLFNFNNQYGLAEARVNVFDVSDWALQIIY